MELKEFSSVVLAPVITYVFGDVSVAFEVMIILATFNMITGIIKGIKQKTLSSDKFFDGMCRILLMVQLVGMTHQIDRLNPNLLNDFQYLKGICLKDMVIYYYILYCSMSVLENYILLDMPFPEKLKDIFEVIKTKQSEPIEK